MALADTASLSKRNSVDTSAIQPRNPDEHEPNCRHNLLLLGGKNTIALLSHHFYGLATDRQEYCYTTDFLFYIYFFFLNLKT